MRKVELPYSADSSKAFGHLANKAGFIFLDSGYPNISLGRFDIISFDPYMQIATHADMTTCIQGDKQWQTSDDPFDVLKRYLGETLAFDKNLPFVGGALGFFSYDLGRQIEDLPATAENDINLPEMMIGLYDWAVVVDHQEKKSWLVGQGRDQKTFDQWDERIQKFSKPKAAKIKNKFKVTSEIVSNFTQETYAKAFDRIKHYIHEGDCYQVNLAQRFSADVCGDQWDAYCKLRKMNPAPFAAYMRTDSGSILSSSPERFLLIRNNDVETKPIKGTRPRSDDPKRDQELAEELKNSKKDQAENVMIVDLLRNDIGKNCATGSVSVPKLFAIESYKTVHHLVSTVTGKLAEGKHVLDLIKGAFPGGSITGAPKLRSMEVIEELEPHRRSVYCGSIGYISFDGQSDTNIAIRTMIWEKDKIYFQAGGGIVMDSEMESEYQETYDKAEAMLKLLKSAQKDSPSK
ncbi:MAG: aminodeoxychorismate synthase component I [Gammaproteobacteria bacterium]